MKVNVDIPPRDVTIALEALKPHVEGITDQSLRQALQQFTPETGVTDGGTGWEVMLRKRQVADKLTVSLATVDRMLKAGKLPKRIVNGSVRIPASAVRAIVEGRTNA